MPLIFNFQPKYDFITEAIHGMRSPSTYSLYTLLTRRLLIFVVFLLVGVVFLHSTHSLSRHSTSEELKNETIIIAITPTHKRLERLADMTRLSNTLQHVKNLHWIVVEDGDHTVPAVERILYRSRLPFIYLNTRTAKGFPARGWTHRNLALTYIRENYHNVSAVVYFCDDDNAYDVRLFTDFIRNVKRIGIWAVGLVGGAYVEAPKVKDGKVKGWNVVFAPQRNFATDMAGFAVNLNEIQRVNANFGEACVKTYKQGPESCFLSQFGFNKTDLEPFGYNHEPQEVFVWHTRTLKSKAKGPLYGYVFEA